jgi:hypothetical protein
MMNNAIEFQFPSKTKKSAKIGMFLTIPFGLLFFIPCYFFCSFPMNAEDIVMFLIFSLGAVCAWALGVYLKIYYDDTGIPPVYIDKEGVHERRLKLRTIPWGSIDSIRTENLLDGESIVLEVNDPSLISGFTRTVCQFLKWITIATSVIVPFIIVYAFYSGKTEMLASIAVPAAMGSLFAIVRNQLERVGKKDVVISTEHLEPTEKTVNEEKSNFLKFSDKLTIKILNDLISQKYKHGAVLK